MTPGTAQRERSTAAIASPGGDYYEAHFSAGWPAYNGSMSATDLKSSSGTYDYAVDFFLYDPRTALDIVSDAFAAAWPHPAIVVGAVGSLACRKPASQKSPPEVRTPDVSASGIKSAV